MSLFEFDLTVFRAIHLGWHSTVLNYLFLVLSYSGLGQVQAVAILLLGIWEDKRRFIMPLLITEGISGILISDVLKGVVARPRPSHLVWAHPQEPFMTSSFPSGHTITSFAIASLIFYWSRQASQKWIGNVALAWAVLVGISRIYRGVHWPTDVLGSACGGVLATCITVLILGLYKSPSDAASPKPA